ncbi:MAG: Txe/YoeB family addiction module toxin [Algoriphagus sp.]|jgi:toxin YoeB|uniref:Txe/YoeB family addiction module toxin n=1 Tax=Algoriphagus sp. TaxID=1872435 RepID=UPI00271B1FAE|nr:Txe/YoeB family addiction module toxin [Algoriphagus sp.]MDO8965978.1 Txe/YoeB family addiction module toxin [Algoriphagus sp.]MDP2041502.1 Txe/YoeB family addiction module toxin [Algoriphagus sp.]MDP3198504.1 Txe/YoeB family addiction module toxin [Algoriphagus sp.]MDP3470519.1 Txe/YoeB family addiction module toxin [Algoriphagus sp.]
MNIIFSNQAWDDYLYWNATDKKIFKKINTLIKECQRTPFSGTGKPEPLKHELAGFWSRRIDKEHRLVYRVKNGALEIAQFRHHY